MSALRDVQGIELRPGQIVAVAERTGNVASLRLAVVVSVDEAGEKVGDSESKLGEAGESAEDPEAKLDEAGEKVDEAVSVVFFLLYISLINF